MSTITIELDEQTAAVVQELAANQKRSASEVIHDALVAYSLAEQKPPMPVKRRKLPIGVGKYRSGQSDIAQNAREILRRDVEEGKWP